MVRQGIERWNLWRRRTFFGWWIVSGAVGIQILQAGLFLQAFGVYVVAWQEEFGWSKTAIAIAFALQRAVTGLLGPLQGWLLDRYGARNVMRAGTVVFAFGFVLLSRTDTLPSFYLASGVLAVGASLGGFLSLMTTIVNWFERKRATALATMQLGISIGGLLIPLVAWSLAAFGWRSTSLVTSLIVLLFGLPLTQLMRSQPEDYGLLPDGHQPRKTAGTDRRVAVTDERGSFSLGQALRTRAFWLLSLGHALAVMIVASVTVHFVVHLTEERGYALQLASLIVALMTALLMAGQILGGLLGDRLSKRLIASVAMLAQVGALLALALGTTLFSVLLFALVHGLAWGVRGPLMGALRADYFGRSSFATIMGISTTIIMLGSMSGPILVGYLADQLGSYRTAFLLLTIVSVIGSLCFALAKRPRAPRSEA
ncbi:MAG: MFS transporter [Trueperaceae bacterium]|nr:MAG: MFS transporter [Trueperaceae bacterium]